MKKYFCSSDIHSFYEEWLLALDAAAFDINNPEHIVIICGDLFDRGMESNECFSFAQQLAEANRLIYIRGNHEDLLYDCVKDLTRGHLHRHHISNGTVNTIAGVLGVSQYDLLCDVVSVTELQLKIQPLLDFIDRYSVDYYELGDKVFVHGWIPTTTDGRYEIVGTDWRQGDWSRARWECGFDSWRCKLLPPNDETVVCGHWHTSYGWSEFRGRSEWGTDAEFTPFIDNKIIAIDACTPYTHMVNVVVFDEHGNLIKEENHGTSEDVIS